MSLPFTREQFFEIFRAYNAAIWPTQVFLLVVALGIVALALQRRPVASWIASGLLGALWVWTGVAYHLLFFSSVNKLAYLFGGAFVIQGLLILIEGPAEDRLQFRPTADASGITGGVLIAYALAVYPALGLAFGHLYPASPTFGVPCPVTIFTFGLLLWTKPAPPLLLLWIPTVWALIGLTAIRSFGMIEDLGLPMAAVVATLLILRRRRFASAIPWLERDT